MKAVRALIKKLTWRKAVLLFLVLTLVLSIIFTIVQMISAPNELVTSPEDGGKRYKSDYALMLIQCVLGLIAVAIPLVFEKKLHITISNYMLIPYCIFLYCAIYLGEVKDFFYLIPHWDTVLHGFSGGMLGALGFFLVAILNDAEKVKMHLSPFFVCLFAFCFALTIGTLWEIYEFVGDGLLNMNMQKFALEDGTLLVGRAALADTMNDFIVDALSALVVTIIGYFTTYRKRPAIKKKHVQSFE